MKLAGISAMALIAAMATSTIGATDADAGPRYSRKVHGLVAPPGKCGVNFYWSAAACKCLDARWKKHYPNW